ncbi:MAG: 5'/3'-nucleotidase SurE [Calditrichaceae bacterium]
MNLFQMSLIFLIFSFHLALCQNSNDWPNRVLITNDNGIDDIKIIELAKAFSKISETYVVAPNSDKSGSTNYLGAIRNGRVEVEKVNISDEIKAYSVDGYPADCVVLAIAGIMKDNPPDLVISGINGGPNLGADWLGSGTIGAARIASIGGFRAIAVSGLKSDIPGSIEAATDWVVRFAQSSVVRELKPPQYLTLSIPRISSKDIKGIKVADRAGLQEIPILEKVVDENMNDAEEVWQITGAKKLSVIPDTTSDISLYDKGYITIIPMIAREVDYSYIDSLKKDINSIPKW